jgi:hypothetical protein
VRGQYRSASNVLNNPVSCLRSSAGVGFGGFGVGWGLSFFGLLKQVSKDPAVVARLRVLVGLSVGRGTFRAAHLDLSESQGGPHHTSSSESESLRCADHRMEVDAFRATISFLVPANLTLVACLLY